MQEAIPTRGASSGWRALSRCEAGAMADLRGRLEIVAPLDSSLLLTGETGTGKGLAARLVHEHSRRAGRPFVHVDCAALSPTLIESELFGHEKGAFTNAAAQRVGRFEWARDGTIFLDEIGDLEPRLQTKLLRVLDDRAFERLGGTQTLAMRARIVAATSHDLRRAVAERRFRADLYYRLAVFHFTMPPLRRRLEELPTLVDEGLGRACRRLGIARPVASPEFLARLALHAWPGNIRELFNLLEQVAVVKCGERLAAGDLDGLLEGARDLAPDASGCVADASLPGPSGWRLPELRSRVDSREREEIIRALEQSRGNIAGAARRMKLARSTLRHRMKKHELGGG